MEEFIRKNKTIIGLKFEKYRNLLGYTKAELAILLSLSPSTIGNIEKGGGFSINTLLIYSYNMNLSASEIIDISATLPDPQRFKKDFDKRINKINPMGLKKVEDARKTLKNIITELASELLYFKNGKTVDKVGKYLESDYGKNYESSVISQALINAVNEKLLSRKKINNKDYTYFNYDKKY